eukprot:TRINITY_DN11107_c0_g1_i1.p1 TRINITY_DN11107_c0_g1~~TRINITY_DN11107_c0_g1_i1.p1  ORF type:complete len:171 (-),score=19.58 TRINITY_DN11107_c0_g1_i1:72-584(-)
MPSQRAHAAHHRKKESYFNCGNHEDYVAMLLTELADVTRLLVYRTSNWVCDERIGDSWGEAIKGWHDPANKSMLETLCRDSCEGFSDARPCADEVFDARSSVIQYHAELKAIAKVKKLKSGTTAHIATLDAFNMTFDRCDATEDGRHYRLLDSDLARRLVAELASLGQKT